MIKMLKDPRFWLFFAICIIMYAISEIPFYTYRIKSGAPDTTPLYAHKDNTDYFTYIAFIRESRDGAWTVPALYTTEPAKRTANYAYYIFLGKISRITGLSPIAVYHLSDIISLLILIPLTYQVCVRMAGNKLAFWAALTGLLMAPPYDIFGYQIIPHSKYWTMSLAWIYTNPLVRLDLIPHYGASGVLILWSLINYLDWIRDRSNVRIGLISVLGFLSSIIHPATALIYAAGLPLATLIYSIHQILKRQKIPWRIIVLSAIPLVTAEAALIIVKTEAMKGMPWSEWLTHDFYGFSIIDYFDRDFILSGGVLAAFCIPTGILYLLRNSDLTAIFTVIWAFLPYILTPVAPYLEFATFRLAFIFNSIPMGVLGVKTVSSAVSHIRLKPVRVIIPIVLFLAYAYVSAIAIKEYLAEFSYWSSDVKTNTYATSDELSAISYLAKNAPDHPVILSNDSDGLLIPALAPAISYVAHPVLTINFFDKLQAMWRFMSAQMTFEEAVRFLKTNNISYIYYGPNEKTPRNIESYSLPLSVWYRNGTVTIYKTDQISAISGETDDQTQIIMKNPEIQIR